MKLNEGQKIRFEWLDMAGLSTQGRKDGIAEGYRVIECKECVSGIIIHVRHHGKWSVVKEEPAMRPLVIHLLDKIQGENE